MEFDNYSDYVRNTVESYPQKLKKHLIDIFEKKEIIIRDDKKTMQVSLDEIGLTNIANQTLDEQLDTCFSVGKKAIEAFEEWEFEKDYKYSILFETDDFENVINKVNSVNSCAEKDACLSYNGVFENPVILNKKEYLYLKFNLMYSNYNIEQGKEILLKYPFLVVFDKKLKIIEFRFDTLKSVFLADKNNKSLYIRFIDNMIQYIQNEFQCKLKTIDLSFVKNLNHKGDKNLKLVAQSMRFRNGGHAQLEVGNNEEFLLPFIDELKSLMYDFRDDLDKSPKLKNALEEYINEKVDMSDYPWVELLWINDKATRNIRVKFIFNYLGQEYTLMQHLYSQALIGMERMNYVKEYIIKNREYCDN